jgi:hypothetical protein
MTESLAHLTTYGPRARTLPVRHNASRSAPTPPFTFTAGHACYQRIKDAFFLPLHCMPSWVQLLMSLLVMAVAAPLNTHEEDFRFYLSDSRPGRARLLVPASPAPTNLSRNFSPASRTNKTHAAHISVRPWTHARGEA